MHRHRYMKWEELKALEQVQQIKQESSQKPVLIFKYSTRCNISRTSLDRLERQWQDEEMSDTKAYFLDLLAHRELSRELAAQFNVEHESPQILLIRNGASILDLSHFQIEYDQIRAAVRN